MPDKPEILTHRRACSSKLFAVDVVELRFSNGEQREYEYLVSGKTAAVIVVAMVDDQHALLVEEYGIGIEGYQWSVPKGKVDSGETHIEAANRELKEEAGYGAKELTMLNCMTQSPNYMQHKTQIVLAQNLYIEKLDGDEPEPLAVKKIHLDHISQSVISGELSEARSIAALYLARDYLSQN